MFAIIFLYMLLASTFTFGKAVLSYSQPVFFIAVRMLISGFLLLGFTYFFRPAWWRLKKEDWLPFSLITLFHIYFSFVLEFIGLQSMNSSKACLLYGLSPFFTALFSYMMLHERLNTQKWIGLVIGFISLFPLLVTPQPYEGATFLWLSLPEIFMIFSVMSSAIGWITMKHMVKDEGYSPIMVNGVGMLLGGVLAFITSMVCEFNSSSKVGYLGGLVWNIPKFAWYTGLMIVMANIIVYNMYALLLKRYSATFISFAGFLCPLFAAVYGWYLLSEVVTTSFFVSVAGITVGLYVFYRQELREQLES